MAVVPGGTSVRFRASPSGTAGRRVLSALLPAVLSLTAVAAETLPDLQVTPAYFSGGFGSSIDTQIAYLPLILVLRSTKNEFRATVPYLNVRTEEPVSIIGGEVIPNPDGSTSESGLGDVVLQDDVYFLGGRPGVPWVYGGLRVKLATGDETQGLGSGAIDIGPGLGTILPVGKGWSLFGEARYVFRGDPPDIDYLDTWWLSGGAQVRISEMSLLAFFYDRRESVLPDRPAIEDVSLDYGRQLSPTVRFRSTLFVGLSETAEDYGLMVGFAFRKLPSEPPH